MVSCDKTGDTTALLLTDQLLLLTGDCFNHYYLLGQSKFERVILYRVLAVVTLLYKETENKANKLSFQLLISSSLLVS